jgi:hypothetical protein
MSTAQTSVQLEAGTYVTDGRHLYYVLELVQGQTVLFEDALDGGVIWRPLDELAGSALRMVQPEPLEPGPELEPSLG